RQAMIAPRLREGGLLGARRDGGLFRRQAGGAVKRVVSALTPPLTTPVVAPGRYVSTSGEPAACGMGLGRPCERPLSCSDPLSAPHGAPGSRRSRVLKSRSRTDLIST